MLLAGGRVFQPGAGEPYRADVAFDVLDDDPLAASCAEPGWPGASRIREVGDARLIGSARRVDVAGRLLAPAFTASVRGLAARSWLTAEALVGRGSARGRAARLARGPGRAARGAGPRGRARAARAGRRSTSWTPARRPTCWRSPRRPGRRPRPPSSRRSRRSRERSWRERSGGRPARRSFSGSWRGRARPPLRSWPSDARASLVVLRPREEGALDAARLDLETVFVDGREPGGTR